MILRVSWPHDTKNSETYLMALQPVMPRAGVPALAPRALVFLLALSALFVPTACRARPLTRAEVAVFADSVIAAGMAEENIPGAALVVVQDGRVLYQRGYGFADVDKKRPVSP